MTKRLTNGIFCAFDCPQRRDNVIGGRYEPAYVESTTCLMTGEELDYDDDEPEPSRSKTCLQLVD